MSGRVVGGLRRFGAFWWDFIVGDDWRIAAGVIVALIITAVLVRVAVPAWWLLPAAALIILTGSLLRAAREAEEARAVGGESRAGLDWYGFTLSFKGVLLEGLEVVFIVLTFGANQGSIGLAVIAAAAAVIVVAALGAVLRVPLARVPENTLKFAVGVLLTSFGTFWAAEGVGAHWPGADVALVVLIGVVLVAALMLVLALRSLHSRNRPPLVSAGSTEVR